MLTQGVGAVTWEQLGVVWDHVVQAVLLFCAHKAEVLLSTMLAFEVSGGDAQRTGWTLSASPTPATSASKGTGQMPSCDPSDHWTATWRPSGVREALVPMTPASGWGGASARRW